MHLLADDEDMRVHSAPADHPNLGSSPGGPRYASGLISMSASVESAVVSRAIEERETERSSENGAQGDR
jgi:hypothetical protein